MAHDGSRVAHHTHHRRYEQAEKQKGMAFNPQFLWCTYANSKHLNTIILPHLLPHLLEAALKYRLEIAPVDLEWLRDHDGRFMKFIHPNSKHFRSILSRKKYRGKTQDYVEQAVLTSNHSVVGYSPRFIGRDLSPNYFDNQEHWLCALWNFLAIIGDYESMLILLSAPPPNCPSVNFASAQGLVLHKFNVPLAPLCHSCI